MTVQATFNHIAQNTKQTFIRFKDDIKDAASTFNRAPAKEKTWVLVKTLAVAIACGLIAFAASALICTPGIAPTVAGFVVGGVYAFYRFARTARPEESLARAVVNTVRNAIDSAMA